MCFGTRRLPALKIRVALIIKSWSDGAFVATDGVEQVFVIKYLEKQIIQISLRD
jgi:hypothetical protein